jgi:hypothetical protein
VWLLQAFDSTRSIQPVLVQPLTAIVAESPLDTAAVGAFATPTHSPTTHNVSLPAVCECSGQVLRAQVPHQCLQG